MSKKETKVVINWGLDIAEEYMLKKFSKLARQGWKLDSMNIFGFEFVKSEPQNKIFAVDYQPNVKDVSEYKAIFEGSGWELACSCGGMFYIFSAEEGTCEIYTDKTELKNKINSRFCGVLIAWIVSLAMTIIISTFMYMNNRFDGWIFGIGLIFAGIWGMCTPWLIGLINKKRKLR